MTWGLINLLTAIAIAAAAVRGWRRDRVLFRKAQVLTCELSQVHLYTGVDDADPTEALGPRLLPLTEQWTGFVEKPEPASRDIIAEARERASQSSGLIQNTATSASRRSHSSRICWDIWIGR